MCRRYAVCLLQVCGSIERLYISGCPSKTALAANLVPRRKKMYKASAVAKSETFCRVTGQSKFADKRLAATKASDIWFS